MENNVEKHRLDALFKAEQLLLAIARIRRAIEELNIPNYKNYDLENAQSYAENCICRIYSKSIQTLGIPREVEQLIKSRKEEAK